MKTSRLVLTAALFLVPAAALAETSGEPSVRAGVPQAARRAAFERAASINQERLRQAYVHADLMRGAGERVKESLSTHIESMGLSDIAPVVAPLPRAVVGPFSLLPRSSCARVCTGRHDAAPGA